MNPDSNKKQKSFYIEQEFCVICNGAQLQRAVNPIKLIFGISFVILLFSDVVLQFYSTKKNDILLFIIIIFYFSQFVILTVFVAISSSRDQSKKAKSDVLNFRINLNVNSTNLFP